MTRRRHLALRLRRITAVAAVFVAAAPAPSASAGTYEVPVCGGNPNRSWTTESSSGMGAYGCTRDGLVVRNEPRGAGGTVPLGSAGLVRFTAPAGTSVAGITPSASYLTRDDGWQAALSNGRQVLQGCGAGAVCALNVSGLYFDVPASDVIYIEALCTRAACPADDVRAQVAVSSASVRVRDDGAPVVADPSGPAWNNEWIGLSSSASFNAADPSGVMTLSAAIDGSDVGYQSRPCDLYRPRCDDWPGAAVDVNARGFDDGIHKLTLKAEDRAGNIGSRTRQVGVDNTPPPLPVGVRLADGSGPWRATAASQLTWTNPPQAFAPIVGASYEACVAGTTECVTGSGGSPTSLEVALPHPGLYDVRVWTRDSAGNAAKQNAAEPVQVGWDADAPQSVAFEPIDPANPALIRVRGTDTTSGITAGSVEFRRKGAKLWRPIRTAVSDGTAVATMPDGRLRDGRYQLRAMLRDAAGNARSTAVRTTGKPAGVTLPLRVKARLVVGKRKAIRKRGPNGRRTSRTVLDTSPRVRAGQAARIDGRLVAPGGNPLAGAAIDVTAKPAGRAAFVAVGRVTTGRKGRFTYKSPAGANRTLRFSYPGAAKIRPQLKRVRVRVPAQSSIRASRHRVVNGEAVVFSGEVRTRPLPTTGKLVELQFYDRGRWRTFRTAHANARGRWKYTYRFSGTVGRRVYRFRVHMPRESGYTYADGGSRAVRVTVQGL